MCLASQPPIDLTSAFLCQTYFPPLASFCHFPAKGIQTSGLMGSCFSSLLYFWLSSLWRIEASHWVEFRGLICCQGACCSLFVGCVKRQRLWQTLARLEEALPIPRTTLQEAFGQQQRHECMESISTVFHEGACLPANRHQVKFSLRFPANLKESGS